MPYKGAIDGILPPAVYLNADNKTFRIEGKDDKYDVMKVAQSRSCAIQHELVRTLLPPSSSSSPTIDGPSPVLIADFCSQQCDANLARQGKDAKFTGYDCMSQEWNCKAGFEW